MGLGGLLLSSLPSYTFCGPYVGLIILPFHALGAFEASCHASCHALGVSFEIRDCIHRVLFNLVTAVETDNHNQTTQQLVYRVTLDRPTPCMLETSLGSLPPFSLS